MKTRCPKCQKLQDIPAAYRQQEVKCLYCKTPFIAEECKKKKAKTHMRFIMNKLERIVIYSIMGLVVFYGIWTHSKDVFIPATKKESSIESLETQTGELITLVSELQKDISRLEVDNRNKISTEPLEAKIAELTILVSKLQEDIFRLQFDSRNNMSNIRLLISWHNSINRSLNRLPDVAQWAGELYPTNKRKPDKNSQK